MSLSLGIISDERTTKLLTLSELSMNGGGWLLIIWEEDRGYRVYITLWEPLLLVFTYNIETFSKGEEEGIFLSGEKILCLV